MKSRWPHLLLLTRAFLVTPAAAQSPMPPPNGDYDYHLPGLNKSGRNRAGEGARNPQHPKYCLLALVLVLCLTVFGATRSADRGKPPATPRATRMEALDAFDQVVQQRFHDVIGFGMARVASQRWFVPKTQEEKDAVNGIKRSGYEVCLYLVGRTVLQDVPEWRRESQLKMGSSREHMMNGPVFVGKETIRGLPDSRAMWEPARTAFRMFENGTTPDSFENWGWTIEARPVKASEEQCLSCHGYDLRVTFKPGEKSYRIERDKERNQLRVGDPVGVLFYAYRKKR